MVRESGNEMVLTVCVGGGFSIAVLGFIGALTPSICARRRVEAACARASAQSANRGEQRRP
jgi:hypothetical protein